MAQISRRTFIRRMAVGGGTLAWLCTGIEFAHAAGPEALSRRAATMKRITDFIDSAREIPGRGESPPPIAPEGIVAGIHAVVHARLATGTNEGFRELLPEFMYFAVLPYFGSDAAEREMEAARA